MSQTINVCVRGDWGRILPMVTSDLDMHVHMYEHVPAHANVFRRTTPTDTYPKQPSAHYKVVFFVVVLHLISHGWCLI